MNCCPRRYRQWRIWTPKPPLPVKRQPMVPSLSIPRRRPTGMDARMDLTRPVNPRKRMTPGMLMGIRMVRRSIPQMPRPLMPAHRKQGWRRQWMRRRMYPPSLLQPRPPKSQIPPGKPAETFPAKMMVDHWPNPMFQSHRRPVWKSFL